MAVSCLPLVAAVSLLLLAATAAASPATPVCRVADCPNYRSIRYYEELGCTRSDGSTECCPTSFDCSSILSLDESKCYDGGKTYVDGEYFATDDPCLSLCSCSSYGGEARLKCASSLCWRGFWLPDEPESVWAPEGQESVCYTTFSLDQCCDTGVTCVNDTQSPRNVTECVYRGKTYLEGQFIPSSECSRCVCQGGYDGTLNGPWCRRQSCYYFHFHTTTALQRCAPLFSRGDNCCALGVQCPSDEDTVVRHTEPSTWNGGAQCSFGNHTLNIGDEVLAVSDSNLRCRCEVPPFITCTF